MPKAVTGTPTGTILFPLHPVFPAENTIRAFPKTSIVFPQRDFRVRDGDCGLLNAWFDARHWDSVLHGQEEFLQCDPRIEFQVLLHRPIASKSLDKGQLKSIGSWALYPGHSNLTDLGGSSEV